MRNETDEYKTAGVADDKRRVVVTCAVRHFIVLRSTRVGTGIYGARVGTSWMCKIAPSVMAYMWKMIGRG
jgi:hypothetical protein